MVFNRLKKKGYNKADAVGDEEDGAYDPDTMGRVSVRQTDSDGVPIGDEEYSSPEASCPETEVLDRQIDVSLADEGIDIAAMRRGGMTPGERRRRCRTMCLAALGLAAAAGASVGIALGLKSGAIPAPSKINLGLGGGKSKSGGGGDGGGFVAPPKDLSKICSPVSVSTSRGWDLCERTCADAECCFLDDGHWFSCKADHPEDCSAYVYSCQTLDHVENLKDEKKKEFGIDTSKNKGNGTKDFGDDFTMGSGPQLVDIPSAPSNLVDLCKPRNFGTPDGFKKCQEVCEQASCCDGWDSSGLHGGNGECVANNQKECAAYKTPCSVLTGTPASHPEAIASQIMVLCNTAHLSTPEGMEECVDLCEDGQCCFGGVPGWGDTTCPDDAVEGWCDQYGPCRTALGIPDGKDSIGSASEAKDVVDKACGSGYQECVDVCAPAECCFRSDCEDTGLEEVLCDHYQSCATLYTTDVTGDYDNGVMLVQLAEAPSNLVDLCNSPRQDDQTKCQAACEPAHCCDERIEICKVLDPNSCDGYFTPCRTRWEEMPEEVIVADPPRDIADKCLGGTGTPQMSDECADACSPGQCCVEAIEECKVRNPKVCGVYDIFCEATWSKAGGGLAHLPAPSEWITDHCKDNEQGDECKSLCLESVCCNGVVPCGQLVVDTNYCDDYRKAGCEKAWSLIEDDYRNAIASGAVVDNPGQKGPDITQLAGGNGLEKVHIPDSPPADLNTLCASGTSPNDLASTCANACSPAYCCFPENGECEPLNPTACGGYNRDCMPLWTAQSRMESIPPVPDDIDHVCGGGSADTMSDKKKCQDYCGVAYCCEDPDDVNCDTIDNMDDVCDLYRDVCRPLWSGTVKTTIPPPPGNLEMLCSKLSMNTGKGRMACMDACETADCCTDEAGCDSDLYENPDMCPRYSACSILYETDDDKAAASTSGGGTGGAFPTTADGAPIITIPDPPSNLEEICSVDNIATAGGHEHCANTCDLADCCNMPIEQCKVSNPAVCEEYEPCSMMTTKDANKYDGFVEIPTAPSDLNQICSSDSLLTVAGFTHCEDICDRARCCLVETDDCHVKNPAVCATYEACSYVYEDGGAFDGQDQETLMKLSEDVARACTSAELLKPQGLSACQHMCNDRLCCFVEDEAYSCVGDKECVVFSPCENLVNYGYINPDSTVDPAAATPSNDGTKAPAVATHSQVDSACTADKLTTVAGINGCYEICWPLLCCFSEIEEENCYSQQSDVCDAHSSCAAVIKPHQDEKEGGAPVNPLDQDAVTKEIVDEACSAGSIATQEGLSNCHQLCGPRMCCFVQLGQTSNCVDTKGKECMTYQACSVLADIDEDVKTVSEGENGAGLDVDVEDVEQFCHPANFEADDESKLECIDLCSQRACCFKDGAGSCYETDKAWCDEFAPCQITKTYDPDANNVIGEIEDDDEPNDDDQAYFAGTVDLRKEINGMCEYENLASGAAMKSCNNICDPHKCCWDQKDVCYDKDGKDCDMYEGCKNIYQFTVAHMANTPDNLCTKEAISEVEGRQTCQDKCDERGCCWVDTASGNCYEEYTSWCDEFKQCLILDSPVAHEETAQNGADKATGDSSTSQGTADQNASPPKDTTNGDGGTQKPAENKEPQSTEEETSGGENDGAHPNELCIAENIASDNGRADCQNKCDERACCWLGDCATRKPDWCEEYRACHVLEHPDQLCTAEKVANDDGRVNCQNKCDERACCWLGDCMTRKPDWCEEYKACLILDKQGSSSEMSGPQQDAQKTDAASQADSGTSNTDSQQQASQGDNSHPPSPSNSEQEGDNTEPVTLDSELETICSVAGMEKDVGEACERLCKPQSCCFAADEMFNCKEEQPDLCAEFKACEILFQDQQNQSQDSNAEPVSLESELSKLCSDAGIAEDDGEACKRLCKPQSCCFAEDAMFNCREEQEDLCKEFDPCKTLYTSQTSVAETGQKEEVSSAAQPKIEPKAEVVEACDTNFATMANKCHTLCEDAKCCFTNDVAQSCQGMKSFCGEYAPCKHIYNETT